MSAVGEAECILTSCPGGSALATTHLLASEDVGDDDGDFLGGDRGVLVLAVALVVLLLLVDGRLKVKQGKGQPSRAERGERVRERPAFL